MKDQSLQTPRKEIDKIDDEIVRLLNERAQYVIKIGKLKKASDIQANLHTPAREAEIMERLCKVNPGPFPNDALRAVYREIMSALMNWAMTQRDVRMPGGINPASAVKPYKEDPPEIRDWRWQA